MRRELGFKLLLTLTSNWHLRFLTDLLILNINVRGGHRAGKNLHEIWPWVMALAYRSTSGATANFCGNACSGFPALAHCSFRLAEYPSPQRVLHKHSVRFCINEGAAL